MANLKSLAKDTAIYGLSSIIGRFLNYLMVPLYTYTLKQCSDYGIVADLYAQTALLLVILTFGMETTFFRFINKEDDPVRKMRVYSTALSMVGGVALAFAAIVLLCLNPISAALGYEDHRWYVGMLYLCVAQDAWQAIMFAYLRNQHRPVKFACLKLAFIFLSVGLNLMAFVVMPRLDPSWEVSVKWVFVINLICTTTISLCMFREWTGFRWVCDRQIVRDMLRYTWPLLVLGIAGILNQVAGQILLPRILDTNEGRTQLGIYEACIKIAMIMALITQAFRYAYEPIVFGSSRDRNSKELYAKAMKYFILFTLVAYLCVIAYMPLLQYIVGRPYRVGLHIIPIAMASEVMMGVVFNLSFWYKLIDKTIYGAWLSIAGAVVLFAVNFICIPRYGYVACAWAGFAGYGTTMVLSYLLGQKHNPINYPLRSILAYTLFAAALFVVMVNLPQHWNMWLRMTISTALIILYLTPIAFEIIKKK